MDIRPCPRCCKLVPTEASFCRRCGACMRPQVRRGAGCRGAAHPVPAELPLGSRWASTIAATATAAVGVVLALFALSGPTVVVRDGEPGRTRWPGSDQPAIAPDDFFAGREDSGRNAAGASFSTARRQSTPARRFPRGSRPWALSLRNPLRPGGPEITAVVGRSAGYGQTVTIRGSRLAGARQVLFIGADRGRAQARFEVWDDDQLIATVPDLGPRRQDAAVAVVTNEGVAVSVPANAPSVGSSMPTTPRGTVCIVPSGEVFGGGGGGEPLIVFVEAGATARAARGATFFVRRGGSLWGRGGGDCLLYCERGVVSRSEIAACDIVEVDAVNPCVVPSLFHYTGL